MAVPRSKGNSVMITRTPLRFYMLGAVLLLFTPFMLSAQMDYTASIQSIGPGGKDKKKAATTTSTTPEIVLMIEQEEFLWENDEVEFEGETTEVDPTILPEVEAYRESFLDSDSNLEEWAAPTDLEESEKPGS